MLTKAAA